MAQKNKGKVLEKNFQNSCKKQGIFCTRIKDNQVTYNNKFGGGVDSTSQNPYDFELYCYPHMLCCELKATHLPSISFEREKNEKNKKMLHYHQIVGLYKASQHKGVYAGIIADFQTSGVTYYLSIEKFMEFFNNTDKKSISEKDIIALSPIVVDKKLLRTNFEYDIKELFAELPLNDSNTKDI